MRINSRFLCPIKFINVHLTMCHLLSPDAKARRKFRYKKTALHGANNTCHDIEQCFLNFSAR